MANQLKVVLLQGPVGPCFSRMQASIINSNFYCYRILFNAGDALFCDNKQFTHTFKGNLEEWSNWFDKFIKNKETSVVILFGSDRPIHTIARNICKKYSIKVLSFEEGYFRPGYVSLEEGGNNANSPYAGLMPNDEEFSRLSSSDLEESNILSNNSFQYKCWYGFIYYFCSEVFSSMKQRRLFHKHLNLCDQAVGWAKNYILWKCRIKEEERLFKKLSKEDYYLVPLQLDTDMQSRFQSNGWNKNNLIEEAIRSFANFGKTKSHLVF